MTEKAVLTEADEGKLVMSARGNDVGRIVRVTPGGAYVNPDSEFRDTLLDKLGWGDPREQNTYRLDNKRVERVTDATVYLIH
ncbi:hypothetical protein [Halogranum rubrum]|nr:hypothetical protein [Halogranum salarium]